MRIAVNKSIYPFFMLLFSISFFGVFFTVISKLFGFFLFIISTIGIFILIFLFRDPDILLVSHQNSIISPSDGKIISIEKSEAGYLLVIESHLLDRYVKYAPISATHCEYSEIFENNSSGLELILDTIIGKIALNFYKKYPFVGNLANNLDIIENNEISIHSSLLCVPFGSVVKILLPSNVELLVKKNEFVFGGNTALAKYRGDIVKK